MMRSSRGNYPLLEQLRMSKRQFEHHLERPLILHLEHLRLADASDPAKVWATLNKMIDALNQLLPGHNFVITDDGRIVVREAMAASTGRDENVCLPSDRSDSEAL